MTDLHQLNAVIADLKKNLNVVKQQFMKAIKDKSVPLEDRWNAWIDAPSFLKDFSQYTVKFECMGKNFSWYDDMLMSRNETVDMEDVVTDLDYYVDHQCDDNERYFCCKLFRNRDLLDKLREEILARNLEYFVIG
jgi:hypothetical protein